MIVETGNTVAPAQGSEYKLFGNLGSLNAEQVAKLKQSRGNLDKFAGYVATNKDYLLNGGSKRIRNLARNLGANVSRREARALQGALRHSLNMPGISENYANSRRGARDQFRSNWAVNNVFRGTNWGRVGNTILRSGVDANGNIVSAKFGLNGSPNKGIINTAVNGNNLSYEDQLRKDQLTADATATRKNYLQSLVDKAKKDAESKYRLWKGEDLVDASGNAIKLTGDDGKFTQAGLIALKEKAESTTNPYERIAIENRIKSMVGKDWTVPTISEEEKGKWFRDTYKNQISAVQGMDDIALMNDAKYWQYHTDPQKTNVDTLGLVYKNGGMIKRYQQGGSADGQQTQQAMLFGAAANVVGQLLQKQGGEEVDPQQVIDQTAAIIAKAQSSKNPQDQDQIRQIMTQAQQLLEQDPENAEQYAQLGSQVMAKAQQAIQQAQAAMERRGGILQHMRAINNECPEGTELVYFRAGGQICKKCMAKRQATKAACGQKMSKGGTYFNAKGGRCK